MLQHMCGRWYETDAAFPGADETLGIHCGPHEPAWSQQARKLTLMSEMVGVIRGIEPTDIVIKLVLASIIGREKLPISIRVGP